MTKGSAFRRFGVVTVVAVYVLILVGGIVRSSGAGMGCPDWPKCFGQWIPPTDVSQLPPDYKEIYAKQRAEKNERFAKYLVAMGMDDKAEVLQSDPSILEEADFNAFKTWVEYINRLIGALIGIFILITLVNSLVFLRTDPTITVVSFLGLVLVLFQAWIGSIVVSTNLIPWMITVHMLIALVIVAMLIYAVVRAFGKTGQINLMRVKSLSVYNYPLAVCFVLILVQIVVGTQVREGVDQAALELGQINRDQWINHLGFPFYFHRSFSIAILLSNGWLFARLYQSGNQRLYFWGRILILMIGLEILTGIIMAYFAIPSFAQPVHLLLGTSLFGVQFVIFLLVNHTWAFGKKQISNLAIS